jgi:hypothetical protein
MSATLLDGAVLTVEIGFSTSSGSGQVPLGSTLASINWTDVSSYVRSVSTSRGRSSELDTFQTGSASIVFSNADRRFDPEYTAGPYFGTLTPLRPVRIRAQYGGGATTNLFFGWVEQWPQTYENPTDATVTVTASDSFKILNLLTLPSLWDYQITTDTVPAGSPDGPTQWFKFDDGATPTSAFDSYQNVTGGTWEQFYGYTPAGGSADSLVKNTTTRSAVFDGLNWINCSELQPRVRLPATANRLTVEFWIQTTHAAAGDYGIMGGGRDWGIGMTVNGAGVGVIRGYTNDPVIGIYPTMVTTTTQVNDGNPHHVVLVFDYGTTRSIYVDGIEFGVAYENYPTFSDTYAGDISTYKIGWIFAPFTTAADNFTSGLKATIDELVIYNGTTLSAAQVANHYAIGNGTYGAGQRTDERISTALTLAEWMTDGTSLNTGSGTVQAVDIENKTPLAVAQECETAEQGRLFIDRDGKVKFITRSAFATTSTYNTSQYTFGDAPGELGYTSLEFAFNDRLIFNRSIAGRRNGATATLNDTTSQGQYFIRSGSISDMIVNTDQQVIDTATARLAAYKQPLMRVEQLTFTPRQSPSTLYAVAIGVEIGTRLTVKRRPQGVGSVLSKEVIVEGISHSISPDGWETSFTLSPVFAATFVLDSATFGVLDSNQLGY